MPSQVRALLYLQFSVAKNWLRRSTRSIIVWAIVAGFAFFSLTGIFLGGDPDPSGNGDDGGIPTIYFEASAVVLFLSTLIFAVWRGTGPPPGATAADVIFVLCSPIRARVQFAYLMFREVATLLSVITIVALLSIVGPVAEALTSSSSSLEGAFSSPTIGIWLIILMGGVTRLSVWVTTEQVVVQDARRGHRVRLAVRALMAALTAGLLAFVLLPPIRANHESFRDVADHAIDRIMLFGDVPPLSLAAMIYSEDGSPLLALAALVGIAVLIALVGLLFAQDFAEPIAITAERRTDARGQSIDTGQDLQWSTISQLGAAPRLRVSIPGFGRGPWALFWSSLLRWARYQMSVAWISLVTLIIMGVGLTFMVRVGIVNSFWVWGLALSMPLFSSYSLFLDELRRPFLFMTPGSVWKRLVAAGATSVIDGVLASATLALIAVVAGAIPIGEGLLILIASFVFGFLIQASVAFVQILLPSWLNRKLRTSLTFTLNMVALAPSAGAFVAGAVVSSALTGFVAASVTALVTGVIVIALSVQFFDRLEMPG